MQYVYCRLLGSLDTIQVNNLRYSHKNQGMKDALLEYNPIEHNSPLRKNSPHPLHPFPSLQF